MSPTNAVASDTDYPTTRVLIRAKEVCAMLGGIHRTTLWRWWQRGQFPPPTHQLGEQGVAWHINVVRDWIDAQQRTQS